MKKTFSTQSLLNSRRSSLSKISLQQKQPLNKDKQCSKPRIPSPVVKSMNTNMKTQQSNKIQQKKTDIQQIYEYKIKQLAKQSKQLNNKSKQLNYQPSSSLHHFQDTNFVSALKMQNQKISRELLDLSNENKRLKQLLVTNNTTTRMKANNHDKDYKKEMLTKLNDRYRLKTELAGTVVKTNIIGNNHEIKLNQKNSNSKNKIKSGSRNSITMNLNMSFVKIKSPSAGKNRQAVQNCKFVKSKSTKSGNQSLKSPKCSRKQDLNIRCLFDQFSQKKTINSDDLQNFYSLNKKIFTQFNQFIVHSKRIYTQVLSKVDIAQCYDSNEVQEPKQSPSHNKKVNRTLKKIQDLYKVNSPLHLAQQFHLLRSSQMEDGAQQKQATLQQTPSSSVMSFTEVHNNPERQKSYGQYRLKKLNQNLGLLSNLQNKKSKTQLTQAQTAQPKVYFSKPVSSSVSRKISFNNSLNNSLKNSKVYE